MASTVLIIAGIACILYGVTVMLLGSGTMFFALWYAIGGVLALGGWAVHAGCWAAWPLGVRRTVIVAACLALAGYAALSAVIATHFGDRGEEDLDCIVVLGAQVYEDGPSPVLKHRLDSAYDYLAANPRTACVVSGGQGPNEHAPEAEVMAAYLIGRGIEPGRIILETESLNTTQNLAMSARLVDPAGDRIGIVSNNFHLYRALGIARRQGYAHVCGIAAPESAWFLPHNMLREALGVTKDLVMGNMEI